MLFLLTLREGTLYLCKLPLPTFLIKILLEIILIRLENSFARGYLPEIVTRRMPKVGSAQLSFILILFIDIRKAKLSQDETNHLPSLCSSVPVWYPCESVVTTHSNYLAESLHLSAFPPQL